MTDYFPEYCIKATFAYTSIAKWLFFVFEKIFSSKIALHLKMMNFARFVFFCDDVILAYCEEQRGARRVKGAF
ncbi:MAG: hypothetical protein MJ147_03365 [Clostridia bacterium]|nr:hypothetical protein [Clostridia bacterium]